MQGPQGKDEILELLFAEYKVILRRKSMSLETYVSHQIQDMLPLLLEGFILGLKLQKVVYNKTLLRSIQMAFGNFSSKNCHVHSGR